MSEVTGERLSPERLAELRARTFHPEGLPLPKSAPSCPWCAAPHFHAVDLLDHIDALQAELDALEVRETVEWRVVDSEGAKRASWSVRPDPLVVRQLQMFYPGAHLERWVGRTRVGPTVWTREDEPDA